MDDASVFRFLFRLATVAPGLSRERLLRRLVTGLANHYGATACALYLDGNPEPAAAADPGSELERLAPEDRARFRDLDRRLADLASRKRAFASALELDEGGDVVGFLDRTLRLTDVFAFPVEGGAAGGGAVLLYLPEDARAVGEEDVHALRAAGEILRLESED
jgi:hypothetical protein